MSNLLVRDPFFTAPFRLMEKLFRPGNGGRGTGYTPLRDVRETDSEYRVMADLPGVDADSVAIEVNDQILSISGTRAEVEKGQRSSSSDRTGRSSAARAAAPAGRLCRYEPRCRAQGTTSRSSSAIA